MSKTFEEWFDSLDHARMVNSYEYAEQTWNHQQKKISSLQDQLQWSLKNEEKYKKLTLDNQARYSGAIAEIKELRERLKGCSEVFLDIGRYGLTNWDSKDCRRLGNELKTLEEIEKGDRG